VGLGVGGGVGVSEGVGVGVALGVGVAVGVGVSDAVGYGFGEGVALVDPGLGKPEGAGGTIPRLRVVVRAARITVPSPASGVGVATGSRAAEGLTLICGVGLTSAAMVDAWVAPGRRAPK